MNRKRTIFGVFLFLSLSTAVFAQQVTKADIQALETTVNAMDKRLITLEIKVTEMETRLTNKIEELDKRLTLATSILVGIILTAIALPQVLGYLIGRRERQELQQYIRDQRAETQQQIQDLRIEIRDQRTETQQQIQELRAEMRASRTELRTEIQNLGERLDRQIQVVLEKLSQHQQEIDELKASPSVTPS
ncbi:hypothetical protein HYR99_23640 [Candidatus Poribacteria bacterium]|nr:hypothetical protein [Candidatus Poribacteria bacterium]